MGGVHGVDLFHQLDGDPYRKVSDQGGVSSGPGDLGMVLEFKDIDGNLCCRGIFSKAVDREPMDGGSNGIGETKSLLEFGLKIRPGAEAGGGGSEDSLAEGGRPGEGGPLGHVR